MVSNKGFQPQRKPPVLTGGPYYRKENPGLCLGFQKAYSVVLKKLPQGAKIFLVRQPKINSQEE
ncbi:hypothetical protein, partial [Bacillus sp. T2.9-1]|uniref:hypothetical protein n=1 Tax=Bacillus sp. T2.9-1 TaxID=3041163 RepID=UPI0025422B84